ncbi:MAG: hypothetical protein HON83_01175 [Candidatus Marinimicrobia bacterium]|nr:hypothetical protein [Candidatus Neomarinimicrobiota bacterium]MBT3617875.1 hypothetical protein [Candidatus Neomarinimicrobiota bacterium]MBT4795020.1 hypothetical protein [Candidatus Neomarinimicrobiota bacterium]MBT5338970.1 hypothetical protein [Candidatus Neomarinimicrobiota bacterium]MBT6196999.1 hypothetical protein [Candidatus Neomarinimicrobiota bacterium]
MITFLQNRIIFIGVYYFLLFGHLNTESDVDEALKEIMGAMQSLTK